MEKLRAYISIVKDRFQPTMSDAAAVLLEHHYEKVRSSQSTALPVTVRFLESLIRLTQAHARLMYRNVATLDDAVAVLRVMECSAYAYGFDGNLPSTEDFMYRDPMSMDTCSTFRPDEDFSVFQYRILRRYGMLDHMSPAQRQWASDLLEGHHNDDDDDGHDHNSTTMNGSSSSLGWHGVEAARDVQQDHYGRSYFSQPTTTTAAGSAQKRRRF